MKAILIFLVLGLAASAASLDTSTVTLSSSGSSWNYCTGGICLSGYDSLVKQLYTELGHTDSSDFPPSSDPAWSSSSEYYDTITAAFNNTTSQTCCGPVGSGTTVGGSNALHDVSYYVFRTIPSLHEVQISGGRYLWDLRSVFGNMFSWDCTGVINGGCDGTNDMTTTSFYSFLGGTNWWATIQDGAIIDQGSKLAEQFIAEPVTTHSVTSYSRDSATIPEPDNLLLLGAGLGMISLLGKKIKGA